jgi:hypothetical protein
VTSCIYAETWFRVTSLVNDWIAMRFQKPTVVRQLIVMQTRREECTDKSS